MKSTNQHVEVKPREKITQYWRENTALFGLFNWWTLYKEESLGLGVVITANADIETVIVNGVEYIPSSGESHSSASGKHLHP